MPGLLRSELTRDVEEPERFLLLSEWRSLDSFRAWQTGPDHQGQPSALRPFQDRGRCGHYMVCAVEEDA